MTATKRLFVASMAWLLMVAMGCAQEMKPVDLTKSTIVYCKNEAPLVRHIAQVMADDIERVSGVRPKVVEKRSYYQLAYEASTEKNRIQLLTAQRPHQLYGKWEHYEIDTRDGNLFITGSDPRGVAYGVLHVSEKIGVSPWYWFADVPVDKSNRRVYAYAEHLESGPAVKYRGIFINDEDWGLKVWAEKNYEKDLGDIGPKTYDRVCELLLRLSANMLAPAMHTCTGAFFSHPESQKVAAKWGIMITTSHCEPLLFNNVAPSEWDKARDGEWNYETNSATILKKLDNRIRETAAYDNIYTMGLRGLHDEAMKGSTNPKDRARTLEKVFDKQRGILKKYKKGKVEKIPQIFVPYKETMDIYENGLEVPDDITLVWVDDNYGYMKRVANPEEQKRSGHSGVYYHLSYLGAPHDYLWLNTTPPVLMFEELRKAYDNGADRYWLLNVGDIKPMELGMQTFFDMAWTIDRNEDLSFSIDDAYEHQADFLTSIFAPSIGGKNAQAQAVRKQLQMILDDYYRLAWSRKPEYMGWEYQWDDKAHTGLKSSEFSFKHYSEAQRRLADYQRISNEVERLGEMISKHDKAYAPAFFELVQFPVQGAYQMNRKFLMAQLNQEMAADGRYDEANWAARQMEEAYDSINSLMLRYNRQLDGKWDGMMALATSFTPTCQFYQKPEVKRFEGVGEKAVLLAPLRVEQESEGYCVIDLNSFRYQNRSEGVRVINGLGYDGQVLQFGDPSKEPADGKKETITYSFKAIKDSVDIVIYAVPFWPLYKGKSNGIGVSIDNGPVQVFENRFKEYDRTWKDQVMRNGIMCRLRFAVDTNREQNRLRISADPGQMIQRIILDWGGLEPTYVGPAVPPRRGIY